jgi:methyltransferase (TIGR00027 family)
MSSATSVPTVSSVPVPAELRQPQPPRLNLENQRKQARSLLNAARAGDAGALRRFAALRPKAGRPEATAAKAGAAVVAAAKAGPAAAAKASAAATDRPRWSLHHAQLVIARERGFKSWAKLKAHIEADHCPLLFAQAAAVNLALEMEVDQPLFVDPLARALAGKRGLAFHKQLRSTTWPPHAAGPAPEQSILTRWYDDALQAAVREVALTQVVLLGAAMDTRAFRLRWPSGLVFFEVDDAAIFEHKERVLRRRRAQPACERRVIRASRASVAWASKLLAAGFDAQRPAAFLIPTWLVNVDAATVERVFRAIGELACEGSWLGVDFFSADTLESPFVQPLMEKLTAVGYPRWRFGVRHPETFLAERGWRAECTVLGAPDASYGRWRYGYTPRTDPDRGIPRNYLAVARRMRRNGGAR